MVLSRKDEDEKLAKFMEEQNKLHDKYGFFFPIGTKILGVDENGVLEVKAFLELESGYTASTSSARGNKNKNLRVDKKGNYIKGSRRKKDEI